MAESLTITPYAAMPASSITGMPLTNASESGGGGRVMTMTVSSSPQGDSFTGSGLDAVATAAKKPKGYDYKKRIIDQQYLYPDGDLSVRRSDDNAPRILSPETIQAELLNPKRVFMREDGSAGMLIDPNLFHSLMTYKNEIASGSLKFSLPIGAESIYYLKEPFPRRESQTSFTRDFLRTYPLDKGHDYALSGAPTRPPLDLNYTVAAILDDPRERTAAKPYGDIQVNLNQDNDKLELLDIFPTITLKNFHDLSESFLSGTDSDPLSIPNSQRNATLFKSLRPLATIAIPEVDVKFRDTGFGTGFYELDPSIIPIDMNSDQFAKVVLRAKSIEALIELNDLTQFSAARKAIFPGGKLLTQMISGTPEEQGLIADALVGPAVSIVVDDKDKQSILNFLGKYAKKIPAASGEPEFTKNGYEGLANNRLQMSQGKKVATWFGMPIKTYISVESPEPNFKNLNEIQRIKADPEKKAKKCQEISNIRNATLSHMGQSSDPHTLLTLKIKLGLNEIDAGTYQCN